VFTVALIEGVRRGIEPPAETINERRIWFAGRATKDTAADELPAIDHGDGNRRLRTFVVVSSTACQTCSDDVCRRGDGRGRSRSETLLISIPILSRGEFSVVAENSLIS
jgi:hypothetical protein